MIEIDKSSDGYKQLKAVTQGLSVAKAKAETEVYIRNLQDMQRINAKNIEETLHIQRGSNDY